MSTKVDSVTPCPSGSFQVKILTPEIDLKNCWKKNCQGISAKCDSMIKLPIRIQFSSNVEIVGDLFLHLGHSSRTGSESCLVRYCLVFYNAAKCWILKYNFNTAKFNF